MCRRVILSAWWRHFWKYGGIWFLEGTWIGYEMCVRTSYNRVTISRGVSGGDKMWLDVGAVHIMVVLFGVSKNLLSKNVQPKIFNPFTATGRIYTSPKRPSRWPRTYIYVPPQFRFYAFVKARPPAWLLLHVSEVSSSSVRWSLLALLGLFHRENSSSMLRAVFVQMAGNSGTMKDPSLPSESEITLPKKLATGVVECQKSPWQSTG